MTKGLARRLEPPLGHAFWTLVGRWLRTRRMLLGLELEYVARTLEIAPSLYQDYEAGRAQIPAPLLARIADTLGVPLTFFCPDVEQDAEIVSTEERGESLGAFRVATTEERAQALAERFRTLDLEGQQHLLAIATALSRSTRDRVSR